jgi:hypothetical protein
MFGGMGKKYVAVGIFFIINCGIFVLLFIFGSLLIGAGILDKLYRG